MIKSYKFPFFWLFSSHLLLSLFITTVSCGYHIGHGGRLLSQYFTFSVPFIKGDQNGSLTAEVIKQMSLSGFSYSCSGEDLIIQIELIEFNDENIGFRYDRNKKGRIIKSRSIIPTETRITASAQVTVIDISGNILLGPTKISANLDFDHDYYSSRNGINIFSLGQLDDYDAAYDAVYQPLVKALARKIVDFVCDSW